MYKKCREGQKSCMNIHFDVDSIAIENDIR